MHHDNPDIYRHDIHKNNSLRQSKGKISEKDLVPRRWAAHFCAAAMQKRKGKCTQGR